MLLSRANSVMAFERERNAYITGFSLFLFLVLRRMVDIQRQLFKLRGEMKDVQKRYPAIFSRDARSIRRADGSSRAPEILLSVVISHGQLQRGCVFTCHHAS